MESLKLKKLLSNGAKGNPLNRLDALEENQIGNFLREPYADRLTDITTDLGTITQGAFIAPASDSSSSLPTDAAFTGVAMGGDGWTFGSTLYNFVAVASGALQAGFNYLGKLIAGGGAVTLDEDGISIDADDTTTNSIKFIDGATVLSHIRNTSTVSPQLLVRANAVSGQNTSLQMAAYQAAGQSASLSLLVRSSTGINNFIAMGTAGTEINSSGEDIDTVIKGDTTTIAKFDASLEGLGLGGEAESGKKLKVTGDTSLDGAVIINDSGADKDTIIEGDTNASLVHVDASADAVGVAGAADSSGTYKLKVTGPINTTSSIVTDLGAVVNETGANSASGGNFRVESDSDVSNIFSDATNNNVGFGTSAPDTTTKVHVNGNFRADNVWRAVRKNTDESRLSNTTLTTDTDLSMTLLANTKYAVRGRVWFDTPAAADFKYRFSCSGTTFYGKHTFYPAGSSTGTTAVTATTPADGVVLGTGTTAGFVEFDGIALIDGSNRNFAFQWAQNTSTASNTTVKAGSYLEYLLMG